jgi:hypothetical protein
MAGMPRAVDGEHHIWMLIRGRKNLNLFRHYPIRDNGWQLLSTIYLPPWKKYLSGGFFYGRARKSCQADLTNRINMLNLF